MPREKRKFANSHIYHIMCRGIDRQDIFYDDYDKQFFLKQLVDVKKTLKFEIYSYCLMHNHFHLVIRVQKNLLSKILQNLEVRYSQYFNNKYDRIGHLFHDRFKSKNVESKQYFIDLCRYVHRNPEEAGIATTENYKWSSYNEYKRSPQIVNTKILLYYFNNNIRDFIDFTVNQKREIFERTRDDLEFEFMKHLTDEDVKNIIMKKYNFTSINDFFLLDKSVKDKIILDLKNLPGTNATQLSRVIKVSRGIIDRKWKRKNGDGS